MEQQGRFNVRGFCVGGRVRDLFSMFSSLGRIFFNTVPPFSFNHKAYFHKEETHCRTMGKWNKVVSRGEKKSSTLSSAFPT